MVSSVAMCFGMAKYLGVASIDRLLESFHRPPRCGSRCRRARMPVIDAPYVDLQGADGETDWRAYGRQLPGRAPAIAAIHSRRRPTISRATSIRARRMIPTSRIRSGSRTRGSISSPAPARRSTARRHRGRPESLAKQHRRRRNVHRDRRAAGRQVPLADPEGSPRETGIMELSETASLASITAGGVTKLVRRATCAIPSNRSRANPESRRRAGPSTSAPRRTPAGLGQERARSGARRVVDPPRCTSERSRSIRWPGCRSRRSRCSTTRRCRPRTASRLSDRRVRDLDGGVRSKRCKMRRSKGSSRRSRARRGAELDLALRRQDRRSFARGPARQCGPITQPDVSLPEDGTPIRWVISPMKSDRPTSARRRTKAASRSS